MPAERNAQHQPSSWRGTSQRLKHTTDPYGSLQECMAGSPCQSWREATTPCCLVPKKAVWKNEKLAVSSAQGPSQALGLKPAGQGEPQSGSRALAVRQDRAAGSQALSQGGAPNSRRGSGLRQGRALNSLWGPRPLGRAGHHTV